MDYAWCKMNRQRSSNFLWDLTDDGRGTGAGGLGGNRKHLLRKQRVKDAG